jgi:crossover junction endodeoxyribonuclease RusA
MTFTLARPKSAKRGALPTKKPDVSKLVRSTEDALTDVGLWEDDARVVHEISGKRYPNEGSNAMPVPGCVIRVRQISSVVDLEALAA